MAAKRRPSLTATRHGGAAEPRSGRKNDFATVRLWSGNSRPDFYSGPYWHQTPYLVNFFIRDGDGTDPVEADACAARAVEYARERKGPVIVHALVTRPMSHSSTDTQDQYRTAEDLAEEATRDPLLRLSTILKDAGVVDEDRLHTLDQACMRHVRDASDRAVHAPRPDPSTILTNVTAGPLDMGQQRRVTDCPKSGGCCRAHERITRERAPV